MNQQIEQQIEQLIQALVDKALKQGQNDVKATANGDVIDPNNDTVIKMDENGVHSKQNINIPFSKSFEDLDREKLGMSKDEYAVFLARLEALETKLAVIADLLTSTNQKHNFNEIE